MLDLLMKIPASTRPEAKLENVPCPGEKQACPDGTTCCQMASGQYACCPAPKVIYTVPSTS